MGAETSTTDPYAERPSLLKKYPTPFAAALVFLSTVILTVASFPPYKTPEFAYAMLAPAIFWAYRGPRFRVFAWTMLAAQAVAWTVLLGWIHHVTWGGLLLLGPIVGCWVGVWYLAAWWTMPRMLGRPTMTRLMALIGLASLWVVIEWTRTWFLSGFPWLPLSVSQWERASILQIAAYTGAGGISFVLVAMNIGFASMAHSLLAEGKGGWNFRRPEFLLALFLLMACLSVHVNETFNRGQYSTPLARVAFVQPYIPQEVKWDSAKGPGILDVLEKTTLAAGTTAPDLILWPEASTPWAVKGDEKAKSFVESLVKRAGAPLLLGSIAVENRDTADERWYNAAMLVDPVEGVQPSFYAKRHLVPFGEYVPLRPILGWLSKFVPIGDDFTPGPDSSPLLVPIGREIFTVGSLICYEDVFPSLARVSVLAGSDFLAVLTNNAWYGEKGAATQHAAHSVLRAVETRRPVLRCGNGGWSGWIDEFGSVRKTVVNDAGSIYFRGTETIAISRDSRWIGQQSFYVAHGEWFVMVCAALALSGFAAIKFAPPPEVPSEDSVEAA